jgi:hypothetical protein
MAFILPDYDNCDIVSFYVRKDFSNKQYIMTHYIDRDDEFALLYYIRKYMDTNISVRRPDTPAKLIMNTIPKDYKPIY